MKKKINRALLLMLCMAMLLPAFGGLSALAADDKEDTWEDTWKDTYYPAYMSTEFKTIKDRLNGNTTINPMKLYSVVNGIAFYLDSITGEMVALTLADPDLTLAEIEEAGEIPEYTAYYSTNPYKAGSSQSSQGHASSESIKERLYAQLIVQYSQNNSDMEMNSFTDAAANNQIQVSNIRGGVRVEYSIGREQVTYLVPRLLRADKFDALKAQIEQNSEIARDARTFDSFYTLYDLNDTTKAQKTLEEYRQQYPVLERFALRACETRITTKELLRLENLIKLYTDYTLEQMEIDHAESEYVSSEDNPPLFKLAIEYKADEAGGITIRLNAGNIRFASDLYSLSNVILLPYGGAGDTNNEGYIFTPDGSGSLISFKDVAGESNFTTLNSMYGFDYVYHTITGANKETMRLPVFGVVEWANNGTHEEEVEVKDDQGNVVYKTDANGDYILDEEGNPIPETETKTVEDFLKIGYLAVIEEGDALSKIAVANGGSTHMFVSVYTTFNPRPQDTYTLSGGLSGNGNATWTVEAKRKYTGDYKIRLFMLSDDVTYAEMARTYRQYLIDQGALTKMEEDGSDIPLYIETLGAMEITDSILGIPVNKMVALSSFEDDKKLLAELNEQGIQNIALKLNGWINGGMFTTAPTKMDVEKVLGGKKGFADLVEYTKNAGVVLFPEFEFSYIFQTAAFDGLSLSKDMAETIDGRTAIKQEYDPAWQAFINAGIGILSPSKMQPFYEKVFDTYQEYQIGAISVSSLGDTLSSDFNDDEPLTREDSKVLVKRLLKKIRQENERVLISGGNAYTLEYATDILDVPLEDSGYRYSCASVPFMGMVLHGYKEFAGVALNLAGDYSHTLLKSIENGASPYFVVASNNTAELKDYSYSILSKYYSVRYAIWRDSIVSAYNMLNSSLKSVRNETIENHEFLDHDYKVVRVTYSNGEVFYINYLTKDYTYREGNTILTIPSTGFVKICADRSVLTYDGNSLEKS